MDLRKTGQRIKRLRKEKGMTQDKAAQMLGLTRSLYNETEGGRTGMKAVTLARMAALFDTSADFILTGVETKNRSLAEDCGLSNEAINKLKEKVPALIHILDVLLTSEPGLEFLYTLNLYFSTDFQQGLQFYKPNGEPVAVESVGTINNNIFMDIHISNIPAALETECLYRIMGILSEMKSTVAKNATITEVSEVE